MATAGTALGSANGLVVRWTSETNSPASRAGLEVGDVLVSINGSPIRNEEDAIFYFTDSRVGDKLNIRILRDGKEIEKTMTLTRRGA